MQIVKSSLTISSSAGLLTAALLLVVVSCAPSAFSQEKTPDTQDDAEAQYLTATVDDPVVGLQKKLDAGTAQLEYHERHGYLRAVLRELGISPASQMLVFSKTSFQINEIGPRMPRALYFNDTTYVGWVQDGQVLEIASVDPKQGTVFYTLRQQKVLHPRFARQTFECLQCHSSSMTRNVPGLVVRSVFTRADGYPDFGLGSFITTPKSPMAERWGGWYVTGKHGGQRHMGNVLARGSEGLPTVDREMGANITDLSRLVNTQPYLTRHSDIVALLVLEHQTQVHNVLTKVNYLTRDALRDEQRMNAFEGVKPENRRPATVSRIKSACEPLVEALLFSGEAPLTDRVTGTTDFAREFAKRGPRDNQGRSLYDLDLNRRLLRYPCSYLIYSDSFDALPDRAKECVFQRLHDILGGQDQSKEYAHLTPEDRAAILQILTDTKEVFAKKFPAAP